MTAKDMSLYIVVSYLRSSSTAGGRAAVAAGPDAESLTLTNGILTRFSLDVKLLLKVNVSFGPEMPLPYSQKQAKNNWNATAGRGKRAIGAANIKDDHTLGSHGRRLVAPTIT